MTSGLLTSAAVDRGRRAARSRLEPAEVGLGTTIGAAVFVFVVCGPGEADSLGIGALGHALWALADLMTLLVMLQGRRPVVAHAIDNGPLLSWPILAIASSLWSFVPGLSAYQGLQLFMTLMVGYMAAATASLRQILVALAIGLGLAAACSLALIVLRPSVGIGNDGTWIGAFTHKNQLGAFMGLAVITALVLIFNGKDRWLGLGLLGPALLLMIGSRSGTTLLALAAALTPLPVAWSYRKGTAAFGMVLGASVCLLAAIIAIAVGGSGSVADTVLSGLGKDSTLTGRTVLWQFGLDQIARAPLLGLGYKAYWESPATSAAYLRYVIGQDLWFFHNNFIDVGVAFGAVGLVVFVTGLLFAFWRVVNLYAARPDTIQLWRVMFTIFVTVEATAENPLFQNHSLLQLLLAIAVARPTVGQPTRLPPLPVGAR